MGRQIHALPCVFLAALVGALSRVGCSILASAFANSAALRGSSMRESLAARSVAVADLDMQGMQEMMKDPEKMKELQAQVDQMMSDPSKKKMMEDYSKNMQSSVEKLRADPEMKEFFEDVEKNGFEALKKWEKNEVIMAKFSRATGGPMGMAGMAGAGAPAAPAAPAFAPGAQVIIDGLQKAPELNGKKAMVVPPTAEEQKTLEGTDRLIVRLLDSGDQFAVRPANLQTITQAADNALSGSLEDVSMYNPALQTEAAKLRESGKLNDLKEDPELKPIFDDIKKNGMGALQKYWNDEKLMGKISKAMAA